MKWFSDYDDQDYISMINKVRLAEPGRMMAMTKRELRALNANRKQVDVIIAERDRPPFMEFDHQ